MQHSLPTGWLTFVGRESNPLDCDEWFQLLISSYPPFQDLPWRNEVQTKGLRIFVYSVDAARDAAVLRGTAAFLRNDGRCRQRFGRN